MYAVSPRLHTLALLGFAVPFALTGLFFGGNFLLAQGLLPILCAIFMALAWSSPVQKPADKPTRHLLLALCALTGTSLAYITLQMLPLGSGWASPFWHLLPDGSPASISLSPGATLLYLLQALGYVAFAIGLFRMGQGRPQAIIGCVAVTITALSVYGLIIYGTGNHSVLWLPKTSYPDSLTASFINRNSFATYAGLGMLASMTMGLQRVGEISSRLDTRQRLRAFVLLVLKPGWPWMLAALICFMALVLTGSRAGLTASICGMVVLLGSLAGMRPPVRIPLLAIIGIIMLLSLLVLSAIGDTLGSRLSSVGEDAGLRQSIYKATGNLLAQYPVTGTGLGTYQDAIATVRTPDVLPGLPVVIDHAHNTYLEIFAELGYLGAIPLALAAFAMGVVLINGLRVRRRAIIWPALGVASLVLVGGHALADFSLSIPAVALAALAQLIVPLSQSFPPQEAQTQSQQGKKRGYIVVLTALIPLVIAASWLSYSNYYAWQASGTIRSVLNGQTTKRADIFLAQNNLKKCLSINPLHPTCAFNLAHAHMALATTYGLTGDYRDTALVYLYMAQDQYLKALKHNPANTLAWYRLARISAYTKQPQEASIYLANSILTGPSEPFLIYQRIPLMLSLMPNASAENQRLYADNIRMLWQSNPWQVGREIRFNPAIQAEFAKVVATLPETVTNWKRYVKAPLPASLAVGE